MAAIEDILIPSLTVRESANDGSDFGNPPADYRIWFIGEDGLLHVKDSAGAVTTPGVGEITDIPTTETDTDLVLAPDGAGGVEFRAETGGGGGFTEQGTVKRTAGDLTTASTSFVDATSLTVTLTTAAVRCMVIFSATGQTDFGAGNIAVDLAIDGTRQGGSYGLIVCSPEANAATNLSFTFLTGVLSAASHTFKIQWRVDGGNGKINATSSVTPAILTVLETSMTA